ncbi:hypothetical protein acdb102_49520 [Acidothermaceae bacterium B102]|nr:hypothetical protein acdb102_49520 [Acidothermaceae bacterium B102]
MRSRPLVRDEAANAAAPPYKADRAIKASEKVRPSSVWPQPNRHAKRKAATAAARAAGRGRSHPEGDAVLVICLMIDKVLCAVVTRTAPGAGPNV